MIKCKACGREYAMGEPIVSVCCGEDYAQAMIDRGLPVDVPLCPELLESGLAAVAHVASLAEKYPQVREMVAKSQQEIEAKAAEREAASAANRKQ